MKNLLFVILFAAIALMVGCSNENKTDLSQDNQSTITTEIPSQSPDKGIVTGRIITDDPNDRIGLMIYLGDIVLDSNGFVGGFLDKQRAPSGLVNGDDGMFTIRNVSPGQYSLIIYEVVFGGQAYTDEQGNIKIFVVEGGKTLDLGEIQFSGY